MASSRYKESQNYRALPEHKRDAGNIGGVNYVGKKKKFSADK